MAIADKVSDWQIVIPTVQMRISNDPPIGGRWAVGDICFMSREMTEQFLQPPNVFSAPLPEQKDWILQKTQAFAVVRRQGRQGDLMKSAFKEVREAAQILASTDAFYSERHMNSGFNLQGYPVVTAQNAHFLDTATDSITGTSNQRGALMPFTLDASWYDLIKNIGLIELFSAITDATLDDAWRRQIRRGAACIGRSLMSLERSDAFLYNIFAMETLLTKPGERSGRMLAKRIKGMTGWHLKVHRPKYDDELKDIFETRCDAVHDAKYENLTAEHLLLADLYAKNSLLNVVNNRTVFKNKDSLTAKLDEWADKENWPRTHDIYKLRWFGHTTFDPKDLDLSLW